MSSICRNLKTIVSSVSEIAHYRQVQSRLAEMETDSLHTKIAVLVSR